MAAPKQHEAMSLKLALIVAIMRSTDKASAEATLKNRDKVDPVKETKSKRARMELLGAQKPKNGVIRVVKVPRSKEEFQGVLKEEALPAPPEEGETDYIEVSDSTNPFGFNTG